MIGDVGRYQVTRFILVMLVSIPGLCHVYAVIFSTIKTDFWCEGGPLNNDTRNQCSDNCSSYSFDTSFWDRTLISEYQLVCSRKPLLCKYHMMDESLSEKKEINQNIHLLSDCKGCSIQWPCCWFRPGRVPVRLYGEESCYCVLFTSPLWHWNHSYSDAPCHRIHHHVVFLR